MGFYVYSLLWSTDTFCVCCFFSVDCAVVPSIPDKLDSVEMLTSIKVMCLDFVLLQNTVFLKQEK